MADIKAKLISDNNIKVRLGSENKIKVIPSIGAATLKALNDVDLSNLENGFILVYDSNTNKWTATNILTPGEEQNLIINGGQF
jgi:hypothetical protein